MAVTVATLSGGLYWQAPIGGYYSSEAPSRSVASASLSGFAVGVVMCSYKQLVTAVDLTTSFLSLSTSNTQSLTERRCVNKPLPLFLPAAGSRKSL